MVVMDGIVVVFSTCVSFITVFTNEMLLNLLANTQKNLCIAYLVQIVQQQQPLTFTIVVNFLHVN
jgi:hypothetical protein